MSLDIQHIKSQFPLFERSINGRSLVYLDTAATSQKPHIVLNAMEEYYRKHNANIHRGIHVLAEEATELYEEARSIVARFIGSAKDSEIVFTRNATESINLIARSWAEDHLRKGDEIILSEMEHHANIVPWQMVAKKTGAVIRYIPLTSDGQLDLVAARDIIGPATKIVSIVHMSNVLGTINDVREIRAMRDLLAPGAIYIVDAAQSIVHEKIDVQDIGCDFLVFSGHKMYGPTGIGVLWGRLDLLETMSPFLGGGDMIRSVDFEYFEPNFVPYKFEAGTPAVAEAIGLAAACEFIEKYDRKVVLEHEMELAHYLIEELKQNEHITIFGPETRGPLVSFTHAKIHAHDLAQILNDEFAVCVRAGHHCAMPLNKKLGISATTRVSLGIYNDQRDVDRVLDGIARAEEIMRV